MRQEQACVRLGVQRRELAQTRGEPLSIGSPGYVCVGSGGATTPCCARHK